MENPQSQSHGTSPKHSPPRDCSLPASHTHCEDTSALLISLVEILGYNASIILIPEAWDGYGHAAVGINVTGASGVHYILNEGEPDETSYYYAETTAPGWRLGEMPDLDSNSAYIYEAK